MFAITVIAVGRLKEPFYRAACAEYEKRLKGLCEFRLVELPESRLKEKPSESEIRAGLKKEAAAVRERIPKGAWFCVLTPEGTQKSSEELAQTLLAHRSGGRSSACFLIGSSFGVDAELKRAADDRLSLSKMTFPHHLFRVMLLEQLYRAESIGAGMKYHK